MVDSIVHHEWADSLANLFLNSSHQLTPLHSAAFGGNEKIVRYLMEKGTCDANIKGKNGVSQ